MATVVTAYDRGNQQLFEGDRVIYTRGSELEFGVISKVNPQKSLVIHTESDFLVKHRYESNIDNRKIYKLNV